MKMKLKNSLTFAVLTGLVSAGFAKAAPLLTLTVEASTTGQAGSYSPSLSTAPTGTVYYEVVAQFNQGATNSNTTKTPNGTTDSVVSLANFTLDAGAGSTFTTSSLQNNMGTGSGASAGTTGTSTIDIRAIEQGFTENADAALVIDSGTLTVGSAFTGILASTDIPVVNAGSLRVAGSPVAQTATIESGSDPLVGFSALTVSQASAVPAPSTLGGTALAGFAALGMVALRRRKVRLA